MYRGHVSERIWRSDRGRDGRQRAQDVVRGEPPAMPGISASLRPAFLFSFFLLGVPEPLPAMNYHKYGIPEEKPC